MRGETRLLLVVDTNVLAYLLLGTRPHAEEVASLLETDVELSAPDTWRSELLNVLWLAVRHSRAPREFAVGRLGIAEGLVERTLAATMLWESALHLAVDADLPAYDALFVAAAVLQGVPLVTYDRELLRRFPAVARRPTDLPGAG